MPGEPFYHDVIQIKECGHTAMFSSGFTTGNSLCLPVCFPGQRNSSKMESALKGMNLLPGEQILSFKSRHPFGR